MFSNIGSSYITLPSSPLSMTGLVVSSSSSPPVVVPAVLTPPSLPSHEAFSGKSFAVYAKTLSHTLLYEF